jgi:photosystem II stability/assembly factor-like uncharacterized protein
MSLPRKKFKNYLFYLITIGLFLFSGCSKSYKFETLQLPSSNSFRGISVVTESIVWVSGSGGAIFRTVDKGQSWEKKEISTTSTIDFRDVQALNKDTAIVMSAGSDARIYRTEDGGLSWTLLYLNNHPNIFLDGFTWSDYNNGIVYGDPVDSQMMVLKTVDAGLTWDTVRNLPNALQGEAGFAASGTGIIQNGNEVLFGTGGKRSAIYRSKDNGLSFELIPTTMKVGDGCGIFSLAINNQHIVCVGGSYIDSTNSKNNVFLFTDINEINVLTPPNGYRSCVLPIKNGFISCGRTGVDISIDLGVNWKSISEHGYYAMSSYGSAIWFCGKGGKIAYLKM